MDPNERKGWTEIVTPSELDEHMAVIGQAETNARIIEQMFIEEPLEDKARLLVPGCGTCQMLDYLDIKNIGDYGFTFTDINPRFLRKAQERLMKNQRTEHKLVADDIENTSLSGSYDGVLTVPLLHHIDWRRGVYSMIGFNPKTMYFIIQQQSGERHAITRERNLLPSIAKFAEIANPQLVPRDNLSRLLHNNGYYQVREYLRNVPDEKVMLGLTFKRRETTCATQ